MVHESSTRNLLHTATTLACICGAIYVSWNSWLKYQSEPLSSTTTEVPVDKSVVPSVTVCHYDYITFERDLYSSHPIDFAEMRRDLDKLELVHYSEEPG